MGEFVKSFIKRSMHVSTRGRLPDKLVPGYLYFVEDEGVILLRMEGEVHTYAKRGPQGPQGPMGPQGPQGPVGPGYYPPPSDPLPNPPAPPSGVFPVGTMLQFNSLPYKVPAEGTWEVDVTCILHLSQGPRFWNTFYNVRYMQTLSGGDTLTLQKLIEGANEYYHRGARWGSARLPKAELIAAINRLTITFEDMDTKCPGKATRKS